MRSQHIIPTLFLALAATAAPALAEGPWCVSLGAGPSVSQRHGSSFDVGFFAEVDPHFGLGFESGMAYMNDESKLPPPIYLPVEASGQPAASLAGLTDGITRNRGFYLGPAVKIGRAVYAVASAGLYELSDNSGRPVDSRWGGSAGLGLAGSGRFEPRAELRYRWASDEYNRASAMIFSLGVQLR